MNKMDWAFLNLNPDKEVWTSIENPKVASRGVVTVRNGWHVKELKFPSCSTEAEGRNDILDRQSMVLSGERQRSAQADKWIKSRTQAGS